MKVATLMSQRSVLSELVYQRVYDAIEKDEYIAFNAGDFPGFAAVWQAAKIFMQIGVYFMSTPNFVFVNGFEFQRI